MSCNLVLAALLVATSAPAQVPPGETALVTVLLSDHRIPDGLAAGDRVDLFCRALQVVNPLPGTLTSPEPNRFRPFLFDVEVVDVMKVANLDLPGKVVRLTLRVPTARVMTFTVRHVLDSTVIEQVPPEYSLPPKCCDLVVVPRPKP
jgi:hypothetical protein